MLLLFISVVLVGAACIPKRWMRVLASGALLFALWQLMEDPELIGRELIDQRRRAEAPLADYRAGVTDLVNGLSVRHDRNVLLVGTAMAVLAILPCVSIKKRQVPSPDGGELRQS